MALKKTLTTLAILTFTAAAISAAAGVGQETPFDCGATVLAKCESCHYKNRVCEQLGRKSVRKWRATIKRMIRHGAIVGKEEAEALAQCLAELKPGTDFCR